MVALQKLDEWDQQDTLDMHAATGMTGYLDPRAPGEDRFDAGSRVLDAVGLDLTLDSGILDLEDLMN